MPRHLCLPSKGGGGGGGGAPRGTPLIAPPAAAAARTPCLLSDTLHRHHCWCPRLLDQACELGGWRCPHHCIQGPCCRHPSLVVCVCGGSRQFPAGHTLLCQPLPLVSGRACAACLGHSCGRVMGELVLLRLVPQRVAPFCQPGWCSDEQSASHVPVHQPCMGPGDGRITTTAGAGLPNTGQPCWSCHRPTSSSASYTVVLWGGNYTVLTSHSQSASVQGQSRRRSWLA